LALVREHNRAQLAAVDLPVLHHLRPALDDPGEDAGLPQGRVTELGAGPDAGAAPGERARPPALAAAETAADADNRFARCQCDNSPSRAQFASGVASSVS